MRCGAGGGAPVSCPLPFQALPLRLWRVRTGAVPGGPPLPWYLQLAMGRSGPVDCCPPYLAPAPRQRVESKVESLHATVTPDSAIAFTLTMDTNSLSQSLDSVNTAVSVAGEEEVSVVPIIPTKSFPCEKK